MKAGLLMTCSGILKVTWCNVVLVALLYSLILIVNIQFKVGAYTWRCLFVGVLLLLFLVETACRINLVASYNCSILFVTRGIPIPCVSKMRAERMSAIGKELAKGEYHIVVLEEVRQRVFPCGLPCSLLMWSPLYRRWFCPNCSNEILATK